MAVVSGLVDDIGVPVGADLVAVLAAVAGRGHVARLYVIQDPLPRHASEKVCK